MNTALLFLLVIGIAAVYFQRRKISDGKALFWATVSEPLHYVSDDPDDELVTVRAANARAKLQVHGNRYLKYNSIDPRWDDIWEYVYGATPECPTRDFSQWQDWVTLDVQKRREMWRAQKMEWNTPAAKAQFGGQKINVQPSQN